MSKTGKVTEKAAKRGGLRLLTWVMIGVIAVTTFVDIFCIYNLFSRKPSDVLAADNMSPVEKEITEEAKSEKMKADAVKAKGAVSYRSAGLKGNSEIIITDSSTALEAIESVSDELGIDSPREEYTYKRYDEGGDFDTYTFQQTKEGINVVGYELKVNAGKSGEMISIVGNHIDLSNADTTYRLSDGEAESYAKKRMKSDFEADPDDYLLRSAGRYITIDENGDPHAAYAYTISDSVTRNVVYTVYVDAETGKIIESTNESSSQRPNFSTGYRRKNEYLYDDIRNIYIFDNFSEDSGFAQATDMSVAAKKLLEQTVKAYDFFDDNYTRHLSGYYLTLYNASDRQRGYLRNVMIADELTVRYYDENGDGFADQASTAALSDNISLNNISKEYVKAILPYSITGNSVFYIGLSDLFAELIEDYSDGSFDNSCDWISAPDHNGNSRNIADPAASGNAVGIADTAGRTFGLSSDEQNHDSTVISHTAYRMVNGVGNFEALTTEQVSYLYYISLTAMPERMTYEQFCDIIITSAIEMNRTSANGKRGKIALTDSQLMCVIAAFDESGISTSGVCRSIQKAYTNTAEFTVYDHSYDTYSNYHLTVVRVSDGTKVIDKDCTSEKFTLEGIDPGIYRIYVSDNNNQGITYCTGDILVGGGSSEGYLTSDRIFTKFGSLQRSVALVLDVSGSMDGEPMRETKRAAVKFIDYVLSENPTIDISLITYSNSATTKMLSSSNRDELVNAVNRLSAYGGTNMYSGLESGEAALKTSAGQRKLMFVMSDGFPNDGPVGDDGTIPSAIRKKADQIKDSGVIIYSLGFFHDFSGANETVSDAQRLMNDIASPSCSFNIKDTKELEFAFDELADSVGGSSSIVVRIACPVDVTVKCGGETLSSDPDQRSTRTSFGSLSFEGDNDEIKVLRLNNEQNYELCINGTGEGEMDYSISFANDDGDYTDVRTFRSVPISSDTIISTNTRSSGKTELNVDTDGDGKFDKTYVAGKNETAKEKGRTLKIVLWILAAVIFTGLLAAELYVAHRRSQKNKVCGKCGAPIGPEMKFCRTCGAEVHIVPVWFPERPKREKQKPIVITAKLVTMGICLLITLSVVTIYRSAASTVFDKICDQELVSAKMLYDSGVEDSDVQKKYLSMLTERYLKKVESKRKAGDFSDDAANSIYTTVFDMDMGDASDLAEDYLRAQGITPVRTPKKEKKQAATEEQQGYDPYQDYENYYNYFGY